VQRAFMLRRVYCFVGVLAEEKRNWVRRFIVIVYGSAFTIGTRNLALSG